MKIVLLDADTIGEVSNLYKFNELGEFTVYANSLGKEVADRAADFDIVITNKVKIDRHIMDRASRLQLICISATGTNNVDLEYAREKGIAVKNVEDYSTHSVAQHTFALMLQLLNQVEYYDEYVKTGAYSKQMLFTHLGRPIREIHSKRLGIIGLGNIGRRVAAIAEAFGAEIVYYSSSGKNRHDRYQQLDIDTLLSTCDIVSIHAPLNEKSYHLITYEKLRLMKRGALLLNTGRGGIVNEKDLARALDEDLIKGAGIDVFLEEPIPLDHPYMQLKKKEKLLITPHVAWASVESRNLLMDKVYHNIRSFLEDKE